MHVFFTVRDSVKFSLDFSVLLNVNTGKYAGK